MAQWIEGRVVGNRHWGGRLHSLQVDALIQPFEAGQFTKIGLQVGDEIIGRPYSLVNAPHEPLLDFYFIVVAGGALTERLAGLQSGDTLLVAPRPAGFLTLSEVPPAQRLFLLSTGTGIGPFLSILKTEAPWQRFQRVVLAHAVRWQSELNYRETIAAVAHTHPQKFAYVPFVSREACDFALGGRIPKAIQDGRFEERAATRIDVENTQVMLCGNPQMIEDTMAALVMRGLRKHRRRDPGQISVESYW
jgi:ferredoxin/flavodoxin---NADP+ reductase